jgi:hypothetical protein
LSLESLLYRLCASFHALFGPFLYIGFGISTLDSMFETRDHITRFALAEILWFQLVFSRAEFVEEVNLSL